MFYLSMMTLRHILKVKQTNKKTTKNTVLQEFKGGGTLIMGYSKIKDNIMHILLEKI